MKNPKSKIQNPKSPAGFTLTELLVVMLVLSILAALAVAGLASAVNDARATRTKTVINKIDQLISERWESYRTRAVPIRVPAGTPPLVATQMRLIALRDLMRMEMPDRKADVIDDPCDYHPSTSLQLRMASPSLRNSYIRMAQRNAGATWTATTGWTEISQGAECLYLILSTMKDGDKSALDYFSTDEVGDYDGDGMKEILDGWGRPIEFLRWAPGYAIEQPGADFEWGVAATDDNSNMATDEFAEYLTAGDDFEFRLTTQSRNTATAPDPYDPLKLDPSGFALHPLIVSGGLDQELDLWTDHDPQNPSVAHHYSPGSGDNNFPMPFARFLSTVPLCGTPMDRDANGVLSFGDNITNHFNTAQ